VDRERLVDEVLMLLPVLGRGLGRPGQGELGEISVRGIPIDAHLSPGHVQVLIALGRGPHSIRQLAGVVGVTSPAVTQLVNHLEEHKMVQRRHDPADRRVKQLVLTARGAALRDALNTRLMSDPPLLAGLDEDQRTDLCALLTRAAAATAGGSAP